TTEPYPDQELETKTELHGSSSDFVHTPLTQVETSSPELKSISPEPMEQTYDQPQPSPAHEPMEIGDLEKHLKETKQTFGKAILTLVDRVKSLEVALKRKTKRVLLYNSKEEERKAQGRKTRDLDPLVSLVQELVTPSKTVNTLGEEQVEDISPIILEADEMLTKVQKIKSVDKGKRYKRRKSSKEFVGTGLDFKEVKSASFEKVNTGGIRVSVPSPDRGRREGKAPMTEEEETQASRKTKEQILQEEAGLAKAIRLDALEKALEKEGKDSIQAMIGMNLKIQMKLMKKMILLQILKFPLILFFFGAMLTDISRDDQEGTLSRGRARAKKNKLTQTQLRLYVKLLKKRREQWKLTQLNKFGEELQTKTAKKLKFDDEGTQPTEEKIEEDNIFLLQTRIFDCIDLPAQPLANYKIIKQGRKGVYQIIKENGTDMVYISFGAMLTDISRDDLTELCRIVMKKHGINEPEDEFEKSADVYMLIERKYHLSAEVCKAMLDKKLQGGKPDEDCYKLLKMMEKQAGIRK
ncbi:hypothetical protein Tco_1444409, partial [Tanacetum coccineum]